MKTGFFVGLLFMVGVGMAQTKTEKFSKEFSFELKSDDNTLIVDNINGSVSIEADGGSTIRVEVEKKVTGKTTARLEQGMAEVELGVIDRADTIILYVKGVCMPYQKWSKSYGSDVSGWGYQWNGCEDEDMQYDYELNFKVKIPAATNVVAKTINNGDISVANATGKVKAFNINGSIRLTGVKEATHLNTINGDVDVAYAANPSSDGRIYSLNGDINAYFQKGLSSDLSFKSFNGEFYTNLAGLERLPLEVEKESTGKGVKYKVNSNRYRTGGGGVHLDFETFNGNVYVREEQEQ